MSFVSKFLLCAYAVTAFSYHAAAETVVVAPPTSSSFGTLRVNGQVSQDTLNTTYINKKGQKKVVEKNLTSQNDYFEACRFQRDARGNGKRGSLESCNKLDLNKTHKLPVGSYLLFYTSTIASADVRPSEDKVINLSKIQVPRVAGKPVVQLFIDYTSEREQNKYLFYQRLSMSQDYYSSLQAEYWGRNFYKPYVDSGDYSVLASDVRQSLFTARGEYCAVDNKGLASDCDFDRVGLFDQNGTRSVCRTKTTNGFSVFGGFYSYDNDDCKQTKVVWDQGRAYFLVFPGTYMIKWSESYWLGDDGVLTKTGIVAN
jgi:hypothetical protein